MLQYIQIRLHLSYAQPDEKYIKEMNEEIYNKSQCELRLDYMLMEFKC